MIWNASEEQNMPKSQAGDFQMKITDWSSVEFVKKKSLTRCKKNYISLSSFTDEHT